ncbi:hypothetical protein CARUB_v10018443mg [Capsella rubella]|uniref:SKP1-like protein n=1 Tax=Capsella rubella TaxID=81985 RepID=R0H768_9BRAS|nr:SKP1-like protein 14 [Capsella rubella]EOA25134.1 hypothetical protein CARUB_v10018443mg [Capsella rubella]
MSSQKIVLVSSDGETFEVEEAVARKLQIVGHMIEDDCAHKPIPLQNVTGKILAMVVEYCKTHVNDDHVDASEEVKKKLKDWDEEFMKNLDLDTIFNLILAANYLNVTVLLDLTCQVVADYIKDKKVEEVREIFNVKNDFTPEEEETIRKENEWAYN